MRDSHRLKEKYELSLDNRQIVSITVACLVVLGGVFTLGVVVGKKLSGEALAMHAAQPTDLLGQLDRKTDALEDVKAGETLTFQDELTRKTPTLIAEPPVVKPVEQLKPPEPPKPQPVKIAGHLLHINPFDQPDVESAKVAARGLLDARPEPTAPAFVEKPAPAAAPEPEDDALAVDEDDAPEAAVAARLPETPKAAPVATRTMDAGGLKEAVGKAQRPPAETAADGSWTMQLSAYPDRAQADSFAAGLRDKGYAPYVVEAEIPGKGTWYRVRMGRFPTKDAASRYMEDFRRETSLNAFVTSAN